MQLRYARVWDRALGYETGHSEAELWLKLSLTVKGNLKAGLKCLAL